MKQERKQSNLKHLFPIVDELIATACEEVEQEGQAISCRMGCDHCCHLLVEISWEEANVMVDWIEEQDEARREEVLRRVKRNAAEAKRTFMADTRGVRFAKPYKGEKSIPDRLYDEYFFKGTRPCAFLENGACMAYEARPTPCRLHLVTSDPELCKASCEDEDEYEVPEQLENLKEDLAPVITGLEKDGRWGQMGIMVEAAYEERQKQKFRLLKSEASSEAL